MSDSLDFPSKTRQVLNTLGVTPANAEMNAETSVSQTVVLSDIHLPKRQPRKFFSEEAMASLVTSIEAHGILQPLLVRPLARGKYELVAGERRYRAAKTVGLKAVPVHVKSLTPDLAFQIALLENLQREDLNPVEETEGILDLLSSRLERSREEIISLLNLVANLQKQEQEITDNVVREQWREVERIFSVIGRLTPESFRTHRLPLLTLPTDVLGAVQEGKLEYTKARALAAIKDDSDRQSLLSDALDEKLSVREIQRRVKSVKPLPNASSEAIPQRMKLVYRQIRQAKVWETPKKAAQLEKLLSQLEALLEA